MKVVPNMYFQGECEEALKLYARAFDGEITVCMHFRDADESDFCIKNLSEIEKEYIYHAEMLVGELRFMFSDNLGKLKNGEGISLVMVLDTPNEVKKAYEVLKEESNIIQPMRETTYSSCFVSLIDKFGKKWVLMTEDE
ncbi:VOC family protein [Clostridiaceae bacterium M8S5]|nr:VOC family protein [Clostridiaceae bacterium M8S5]